MRLTLLVCTLLLAGCGTLFGHGPDLLPVSSVPSGGEVFVDGERRGVTPVTLAIARSSKSNSHAVTVRLDGYEPMTKTTGTATNGWATVDAILGCVTIVMLPGLCIDVLTGNGSKCDTSPLQFELVKIGTLERAAEEPTE
jgi:hypothetical protein